MPEWLSAALALPGLYWLALTGLVAGIVRGFSGFGTAMIYLPVAGQFLSPVSALVTLTVMDLFGPLPNIPRALRDAHLGDIKWLIGGLVLALPIGLLILVNVSPEAFRFAVSFLTLALLVLLAGGWRYAGVLTRKVIFATGALGGFLFGAVGLPGPPVIAVYMASAHPAKVIRATLLLYLLSADMLMMALLGISAQLSLVAVTAGVILTGPYLLGNFIGGWIFRPEYERVYRIVAYAIIAVSAVMGLPFWD